MPAAYKGAATSLAVDWTDHETWSRPRPAEDPQPANDPDASFGHTKRNAPGAKDYLFFGYYAQVATMVRDEGGARVPELVRRIAVQQPICPGRIGPKVCQLSAAGLGARGPRLVRCHLAGHRGDDPLQQGSFVRLGLTRRCLPFLIEPAHHRQASDACVA